MLLLSGATTACEAGVPPSLFEADNPSLATVGPGRLSLLAELCSRALASRLALEAEGEGSLWDAVASELASLETSRFATDVDGSFVAPVPAALLAEEFIDGVAAVRRSVGVAERVPEAQAFELPPRD